MGNQRETVLKTRYFKDGETSDKDLFKRVAEILAATEEQAQCFYNEMINGRFLPNTPCLVNAGDENSTGALFACYVLPIEDSMDSIFTTLHDTAMIHKGGGGTGFNFGKLRPKNSCVKSSNGIASGAISFMTAYDAATETVKQGGVRRGANMAVFPVTHPDVLDFIKCKDDTTKLNNFNISIAITDDFIKAVKNDDDWHFSFNGEKINHEPIKARKIMDMIVEQAWKNGEPGVLFIDEINAKHPLNEIVESTNPCLCGDSLILTAEGYKNIKDLDGQTIQIINKDGQLVNSSVWCSGEKDVVSVKWNQKEIFVCTEDHKFMLIDGSECEAKNLKNKRIMPYLQQNSLFDNDFVKYGFIQGDGNLTELIDEKKKGLTINFGKNDSDVADYFGYIVKGRKHYTHEFNHMLIALGFSLKILPDRILPTTFNKWTNHQKISFIRGCYSANGSVLSCGRITYKTTCKQYAEQLNNYLISIGYNSYITKNNKSMVQFENGEYLCKESYDININRYVDRIKFYNEIGFIQGYKNEKLKSLLIKQSPTICSVTKKEEKCKVYDFSEKSTHWGVVNGFIVHNCGEQPLLPYESCCLGSINLSKFVNEDKLFDYHSFRNTIRIGVEMLNQMINKNKYPLPQIEAVSLKNRKIGLGIMGYADMLIKMGLKYGSNEALSATEKIASSYRRFAEQASSYLGETFGCFDSWKESYWYNRYKRKIVKTKILPIDRWIYSSFSKIKTHKNADKALSEPPLGEARERRFKHSRKLSFFVEQV